MALIRVLDSNTIDKIAAGEVVERPASVVKELVENSIDAGASIITVEIKNGGLKLIRVTDNGSGIEPGQVRNAFYSHATSKITDASDLDRLFTLGFRGEALSSIAAVARVEVTSRENDSLTGVHYCIEGGKEERFEEVGAPRGTTFIVRDLFYNTLPRLKFLKSENTEGSYVSDLMEHLALSRPDISFMFINNGKTRFSTSGRGDLREVIYRIFGKEMADNIRPIDVTNDILSMHVKGFLGLPASNRSNRAGEIFYINHRYIKSPLLSKAIEEGYKEYLMQHKFPFCILDIEFDPVKVDVNVHPTKQEVRLSDERAVHDALVTMISDTLTAREMIDSCIFDEGGIAENATGKDESEEPEVCNTKEPKESDTRAPEERNTRAPELFEQNRITNITANYSESLTAVADTISSENVVNVDEDSINNDVEDVADNETEDDFFFDDRQEEKTSVKSVLTPETAIKEYRNQVQVYEQLDFLDNEQLLSVEARRQYRVIGQVFKTYWLIEYNGNLLILDQHAAHEKVNFERFMSRLRDKKEIPSQMISPAAIMTVNNREMQIITENGEILAEMGFSIDEFGEHEIAIRSVPMDLYDNSPAQMIGEILTDLMDMKKGDTPDSVRTRIATMACKASVKGNNLMTVKELEVLLDEMLTLDNPYNCPHGRPTMITMSKSELEKKFHRIV